MSAWFSRAAYRASINDQLRLMGARPATDVEFEGQVMALVNSGLVQPHALNGEPGFLVMEEGVALTPLERGH